MFNQVSRQMLTQKLWVNYNSIFASISQRKRMRKAKFDPHRNDTASLPGRLGLAEEIRGGAVQGGEAEHHEDLHKGKATCVGLCRGRENTGT